MRVLVAYASKSGFTKGIAEFVGEKLRARGIEAEVRDVGTVRVAGEYDAFVIGSAVYMFHWIKEAKEFLARNKALLAARPVWIFSSGPVGTQKTNAKGEDLLKASGPNDVGELVEQIKPRDQRVFFGGLDGARVKGATKKLRVCTSCLRSGKVAKA
jgi:menaquinone-dependent protoporphyrinogen oxidase